MSRLISFVLADSSCEPREESENYKLTNSCPQRDSNPLSPISRLLDWRSNRPLTGRSDYRHLKVNYIHINIDII